ncbi:MAG TPA: hypothetical protein VNG73_10135, partial [Gemmatimonadaceae bacterium]|nr:hypothetical protein [Gemmatimonadaceae bacterium]
ARSQRGRTLSWMARFAAMSHLSEIGVAIDHIGEVSILVAAIMEGIVVEAGEFGEPLLVGVTREHLETLKRGVSADLEILVGEARADLVEARNYLAEALRLNRLFLRDVLPALPEEKLPQADAHQIQMLGDLMKVMEGIQASQALVDQLRNAS